MTYFPTYSLHRDVPEVMEAYEEQVAKLEAVQKLRTPHHDAWDRLPKTVKTRIEDARQVRSNKVPELYVCP